MSILVRSSGIEALSVGYTAYNVNIDNIEVRETDRKRDNQKKNRQKKRDIQTKKKEIKKKSKSKKKKQRERKSACNIEIKSQERGKKGGRDVEKG